MRIAHFSDLHLLSLASARGSDFANKRWIGALNLLVSRARHHRPALFVEMVKDVNLQDIDHVVCTGDITNLALDAEFQFAREHFEALSLSPNDITVIPGNHDTYVAEGMGFFHAHFADYVGVNDEWKWADDDPWPAVRTRGTVAVIAVSTSVTTPWFTAYGEVGDKQLDRLSQVLEDPRLAGMFRLIMIHHSPTGRRAQSRVRGLRDGVSFCNVVAGSGAELIVHGHEHVDLQEMIERSDGTTIPVRGIPSATYEAGKPALRARYRIYEISASAPSAQQRPILAGTSVRIWNPGISKFNDLAA